MEAHRMTTMTEPLALSARLAALEARVKAAELRADRAFARGEIENLFSNYMLLHNAYQDERIIDLWVRPGTPGIRAQYSNKGVYTSWESVTAYHRGRPSPVGKLLLHYTTTPSIQVAADGGSGRGVWIVAGVESGLTEPAQAENAPAFLYEPELVNGKKVWAHWVAMKYAVDCLLQEGVWKIWRLRCYEVLRAPYGRNWIDFAARTEAMPDFQRFHENLAYFGDDGKPVWMPDADGPPQTLYGAYRTDTAQTLEPAPPQPYDTDPDAARDKP
jgi:hypothetical protein